MTTDCYDFPQYWDLAFSEDTVLEADFVVAAAQRFCDFPLTSLLEPGCGGGRLMEELSRRGLTVTGWDLSQASVDFANERLRPYPTKSEALVADMRTAVPAHPVDVAYCLVNTFRHLVTEEDALAHLRGMANAVRPGGLCILGLHLFPPDADEEDEEAWTVSVDGTTVTIQLQVHDCSRDRRLETLRFFMNVNDPAHDGIQNFQTDYRMRLYEAGQITELISKVPEFELAGVYDFWYDIDERLTLSDEMGDTVLVLKRH